MISGSKSIRGSAWLLGPALLLLVGFLLLPLLVAVGISLRLPAFDLRSYAELAEGSFRVIFSDTLRDSLLVTLACLLLGLPTAYMYARLDPKYLPILMLAVLVPYFTSSLIRSYAWIAILGNQGLVNRALLGLGLIDQPLKLAYTWIGVIAAMAQVQLPLFIIPVLAVMQRVDTRLVRASKTLGANPVTAFFTVYLPLVAPGVTAATVMVFMTTLGFYITPALVGPPSTLFLSQSIEARINSLNDVPGAATQSIVLIVITVLLAALFFQQLRAAFVPHDQGAPTTAGESARRSAWRWPHGLGGALERLTEAVSPIRGWVFGGIAAITTLLLVGPLLVLFPLSFSGERYLAFPPQTYSIKWYLAYFNDPEWLQATWLSLKLGVGGAAVATLLGVLGALGCVGLARSRRTAALLAFATPLIISPMVLAAATFAVAAKLGWVGSTGLMIATYAVLALPFPVLVVSAALSRFDWALPRAAATLGATPPRAFATVVLPLLVPAIVGGFVFSFFVGFDDVNIALFLANRYDRPLPIVMFDSIRDEINPRTSAVAVLFFVAAALACFGHALYRRLRARPRAAIAPADTWTASAQGA